MLIYMDKDMGERTAAEDTLEGENGTTEGENFAQRRQRPVCSPQRPGGGGAGQDLFSTPRRPALQRVPGSI